MAMNGSNSTGNNNDQIVYYLDQAGFLRPVVTQSGAFMPAPANMPTFNGFLAAQVDRAVAAAAATAAAEAQKRKQVEEEMKRIEEERKRQLEIARFMGFYDAYHQLQEAHRQPIHPLPANPIPGEIAGYEWFYRQPDGSYSLHQ